jgi:hypothetical protein
MNQENRSYSVKQYMTALKQKVESTPAVWVHGVITQISEKPKVVYMSIADFEEKRHPAGDSFPFLLRCKICGHQGKDREFRQPL